MSHEEPEYCYKHPLAEKHFKIKKLKGVPKELSEYLDDFSIRLFQDKEDDEYFFVTIAIPSRRDDEGFVWEKILTSKIKANDTYWYSAPRGDLTNNDLQENISLSFVIEEDRERDDRWLLLSVSVIKTSYLGERSFHEHDECWETSDFKE